jgi:2-keto-4-pentenoate hydratase/2-oxohepta-3-ene-1,7-dioic acid hydratase in catechol pathway
LRIASFLKYGDVVRIEIDGLGTIENRFAETSA